MTSDTRTLELPDASIAYDVRTPAGASEHPPLLLIGQPMTASGFDALAPQLDDRVVVTYDPRGLGRSERRDDSAAHDPAQQASDLHALIQELGMGPVDIFGSSGGAVAGLALVTAHPEDVHVLVAHEAPLTSILPDAEHAAAAFRGVEEQYQAQGFGAGMAAFIGMTSWRGEFNEAYTAQEFPHPAQYGMPTEDDGSRDDPLMSGVSRSVTALEPDIAALIAAPTRIVVGVGTESGDVLTGRSAAALADMLDTELVEFRGGHGGFMADEWGQPGDPATFAAQLRGALED